MYIHTIYVIEYVCYRMTKKNLERLKISKGPYWRQEWNLCRHKEIPWSKVKEDTKTRNPGTDLFWHTEPQAKPTGLQQMATWVGQIRKGIDAELKSHGQSWKFLACWYPHNGLMPSNPMMGAHLFIWSKRWIIHYLGLSDVVWTYPFVHLFLI